MQNKPNVKYAQINVNSYMKSKYEKLDTWLSGKNKANSNPIKPNLRKVQMNVNLTLTKDYIKKDDFSVRINKANSNPISEMAKMSANLYVIEDYENETAFRPKKTNPKQTQFPKGQNELRAYPNNRVVMRPSEKFEAKAAGQKCSEAWFSPRREHFWPTTQASNFAAGRNRTGYLDRLLTSLTGKSGHTLFISPATKILMNT